MLVSSAGPGCVQHGFQPAPPHLAVEDHGQLVRPIHLDVVLRGGRLELVQGGHRELGRPELILEAGHADEGLRGGGVRDAEHV